MSPIFEQSQRKDVFAKKSDNLIREDFKKSPFQMGNILGMKSPHFFLQKKTLFAIFVKIFSPTTTRKFPISGGTFIGKMRYPPTLFRDRFLIYVIF